MVLLEKPSVAPPGLLESLLPSSGCMAATKTITGSSCRVSRLLYQPVAPHLS